MGCNSRCSCWILHCIIACSLLALGLSQQQPFSLRRFSLLARPGRTSASGILPLRIRASGGRNGGTNIASFINTNINSGNTNIRQSVISANALNRLNTQRSSPRRTGGSIPRTGTGSRTRVGNIGIHSIQELKVPGSGSAASPGRRIIRIVPQRGTSVSALAHRILRLVNGKRGSSSSRSGTKRKFDVNVLNSLLKNPLKITGTKTSTSNGKRPEAIVLPRNTGRRKVIPKTTVRSSGSNNVNIAASAKKNIASNNRNIKQTIVFAGTANILSPVGTQHNGGKSSHASSAASVARNSVTKVTKANTSNLQFRGHHKNSSKASNIDGHTALNGSFKNNLININLGNNGFNGNKNINSQVQTLSGKHGTQNKPGSGPNSKNIGTSIGHWLKRGQLSHGNHGHQSQQQQLQLQGSRQHQHQQQQIGQHATQSQHQQQQIGQHATQSQHQQQQIGHHVTQSQQQQQQIGQHAMQSQHQQQQNGQHATLSQHQQQQLGQHGAQSQHQQQNMGQHGSQQQSQQEIQHQSQNQQHGKPLKVIGPGPGSTLEGTFNHNLLNINSGNNGLNRNTNINSQVNTLQPLQKQPTAIQQGIHHPPRTTAQQGIHHPPKMAQQGFHHPPTQTPQQGVHHPPAATPQQGVHHPPAATPQQGVHHPPAATPQQGIHHPPTSTAQQGVHHPLTSTAQQGVHQLPTPTAQQGVHHPPQVQQLNTEPPQGGLKQLTQIQQNQIQHISFPLQQPQQQQQHQQQQQQQQQQGSPQPFHIKQSQIQHISLPQPNLVSVKQQQQQNALLQGNLQQQPTTTPQTLVSNHGSPIQHVQPFQSQQLPVLHQSQSQHLNTFPSQQQQQPPHQSIPPQQQQLPHQSVPAQQKLPPHQSIPPQQQPQHLSMSPQQQPAHQSMPPQQHHPPHQPQSPQQQPLHQSIPPPQQQPLQQSIPPQQQSPHQSMPPQQQPTHQSLPPQQQPPYQSILPQQQQPPHQSIPPKQQQPPHQSIPPQQQPPHQSIPPKQQPPPHQSIPPQQQQPLHQSIPPQQQPPHQSIPPQQQQPPHQSILPRQQQQPPQQSKLPQQQPPHQSIPPQQQPPHQPIIIPPQQQPPHQSIPPTQQQQKHPSVSPKASATQLQQQRLQAMPLQITQQQHQIVSQDLPNFVSTLGIAQQFLKSQQNSGSGQGHPLQHQSPQLVIQDQVQSTHVVSPQNSQQHPLNQQSGTPSQPHQQQSTGPQGHLPHALPQQEHQGHPQQGLASHKQPQHPSPRQQHTVPQQRGPPAAQQHTTPQQIQLVQNVRVGHHSPVQKQIPQGQHSLPVSSTTHQEHRPPQQGQGTQNIPHSVQPQQQMMHQQQTTVVRLHPIQKQQPTGPIQIPPGQAQQSSPLLPAQRNVNPGTSNRGGPFTGNQNQPTLVPPSGSGAGQFIHQRPNGNRRFQNFVPIKHPRIPSGNLHNSNAQNAPRTPNTHAQGHRTGRSKTASTPMHNGQPHGRTNSGSQPLSSPFHKVNPVISHPTSQPGHLAGKTGNPVVSQPRHLASQPGHLTNQPSHPINQPSHLSSRRGQSSGQPRHLAGRSGFLTSSSGQGASNIFAGQSQSSHITAQPRQQGNFQSQHIVRNFNNDPSFHHNFGTGSNPLLGSPKDNVRLRKIFSNTGTIQQGGAAISHPKQIVGTSQHSSVPPSNQNANTQGSLTSMINLNSVKLSSGVKQNNQPFVTISLNPTTSSTGTGTGQATNQNIAGQATSTNQKSAALNPPIINKTNFQTKAGGGRQTPLNTLTLPAHGKTPPITLQSTGNILVREVNNPDGSVHYIVDTPKHGNLQFLTASGKIPATGTSVAPSNPTTTAAPKPTTEPPTTTEPTPTTTIDPEILEAQQEAAAIAAAAA